VAPLVQAISPALLWHFDEAGWNVLGYEYAEGRHADYAPGSPDLDRLVQFMDALSQIKVPGDPGPFQRAEDRWTPSRLSGLGIAVRRAGADAFGLGALVQGASW
jgi:hypothetical protein